MDRDTYAALFGSTHDVNNSGHLVPAGMRHKPDRAKIDAYLASRAERARNAWAVKANPVGIRLDEWEAVPKPVEARGGTNPNSDTGPEPVAYAPVGGRWQRGIDNAERWIPDVVIAKTEEPKPHPVSVPEIVISSRPWANTPTGPQQI
jgi:hypothetical protein